MVYLEVMKQFGSMASVTELLAGGQKHSKSVFSTESVLEASFKQLNTVVINTESNLFVI